jgi:hypothetical protein
LFDKEDSLIESLPSLYQHKDTEEDTEDDDDDTASKDAPPEEFTIKLPLLSTVSAPPKTYNPQLNFNLYTPSPSVASSIKSSSRSSSSHTYSLSTVSAASTLAAAAASAAAVQTPMSNKTCKTPLYSIPCSSSTYKMDIRSPPQPSQSTSRFLNAFHRFRHGHTRQNANHNNSVAPEDVNIKPFTTKSSLADKIKSKFQKQKPTTIVVAEKKTFSMPRSTSLSSITQWSRRNSHRKSTNNDKVLPRKVMIHSASTTSFMSQNTTSSSCSSSSTVSNASPATTSNIAATSAFSLTKSISSHRLYIHKSSLDTNRHRLRQPLRAVNPNHHYNEPSSKARVRFTKLVSVGETYSKTEYDRGSDPNAVCSRLTPTMAQEIKEELNAYKLHEMQVHEFSRIHTHFFL